MSNNLQSVHEEITTRKPEDIMPTIETRFDTEIASLVKNKKELPLDQTSRGKQITLTFKDLSYSAQIKNSNNKSLNDAKCSFLINCSIKFHSCREKNPKRNDWNL